MVLTNNNDTDNNNDNDKSNNDNNTNNNDDNPRFGLRLRARRGLRRLRRGGGLLILIEFICEILKMSRNWFDMCNELHENCRIVTSNMKSR